jgi:hypothetical protein
MQSANECELPKTPSGEDVCDATGVEVCVLQRKWTRLSALLHDVREELKPALNQPLTDSNHH